MRVFQSISGHSSELSIIANHSPRPTVSQLKCVSDIISNWFKNHQPQKNENFHCRKCSSHLKLESKWPWGWPQPQVFWGYLISQLLQYSTQRPSFSAHRAALMTKIDFTFPALSLKFVHFAAQFCFRCKFSFHEERCSSCSSQVLTVAWFSGTNYNSLLCILANAITSFCIDNRLRQMAFLWAIWPPFAYVEIFWNKKAFRYYIKQIDSLLPCVCSVIDHRRRQNVVRTLGYRLVCHFFALTTFWRHLWSITEQKHGNMESIC